MYFERDKQDRQRRREESKAEVKESERGGGRERALFKRETDRKKEVT